MLESWKWEPPQGWLTIDTIDGHTAGEPLRVFTGGLPAIEGKTILEKRRWFRDHLDHIRTGIMWEPRGHADMYGAVLTEPVTSDGDFGVFFLHNEGYSTMCGHAIIALTHMILDTGMIKKEGDCPELRIDAPAGRITATAFRKGGRVQKASFLNVPSFVLYKEKRVFVDGLGDVRFDVAYGGAFYAFVEAEPLGLKLTGEHHDRLVDFGKRIKRAVMENFEITHPFEEDLSFLYGTIFTGPAHEPGHHSRNVCIFAEGEVDRSPTGTGVSARAALHYDRGELKANEAIVIESILGTTMTVQVKAETEYGPHPAVIPQVTGTASITGQHRFYFDPEDALKNGFIFR